MIFTYKAYADMLALLKKEKYSFCDYHNYTKTERCVILRHDVDQSPAMTLPMAQIEAEQGIKSTWFALLGGDFYNTLSPRSIEKFKMLLEMGHEVGLHFDETAYGEIENAEDCVKSILKEKEILSDWLGAEITTVSMHRPSKKMLEADLQIPGMVNSYGKTFFREFKYLSDSRCQWREPVVEIIRSGEYNRLHILTHAFWYRAEEQSMKAKLERFIAEAEWERYDSLLNNMKDIEALHLAVNLRGR